LLHAALDALVAVASLIAILDYFGVKANSELWGRVMPLSKKWKLVVMLVLVIASLGMSGYSLYRAAHPKIVEKVVEKITEKPVPVPCPAPPTESKRAKNGTPSQQQAGKDNAQAGPVTQGPGSIAQIGGAQNQATVNNYGAVDRHLSVETTKALGDIAQAIPNKNKQPVGFLVVESAEAETFADEIAMAFLKPGIKDGLGDGQATAGRNWHPQTPKGVVIVVKDKDDPAFPLAQQIANAMSSTGVPAVGIMFNPNGSSGRVIIIVGEKTDGPPVGGLTSYLVLR